MSLSSIPTNLAAMINKAYSADAGTATATASTAAANSAEKAASPTKDSKDRDSKAEDSASASAQVTLGQSGNTTEIYTAQGLLQQMRQIQLSNSMLLFGNNEEDSGDSNGLLAMVDNGSDSELDSASEDWAGEISKNPEKAAVMVEKAKNASIKTMLGG
ncbi:MAG: hypothetical protein ACT6RZ_08200 [Methylophilus sp.]|uniref:hypothetical protein n=2 Tax=Methylophilus sp. TaxID=29541 RepID=UPI004037162C